MNLGSCPHCGWNLGANDELQITDLDKISYPAMILGGAQARFRKTTSFSGGAVQVTFRTITVVESDVTLQQAGEAERTGQIKGETELMKQPMEYRLIVTLESVVQGMTDD